MRVSSNPCLGLAAPPALPDSPGAGGDTLDFEAPRDGGNFTPPRTGMCGSGVTGQMIFGIPHQSPTRIASAMANLSSNHNSSFHCSAGGRAAIPGNDALKNFFVERLDLYPEIERFQVVIIAAPGEEQDPDLFIQRLLGAR